MLKVAVIFADGTEEIEAITPADVLKRAGIGCDIVSVSGNYPTGSHNITVKADCLAENFDMRDYDGIVIPGGMPGAVNISENKKVLEALKYAFENGNAAYARANLKLMSEDRREDGLLSICYPCGVNLTIPSFSLHFITAAKE